MQRRLPRIAALVFAALAAGPALASPPPDAAPADAATAKDGDSARADAATITTSARDRLDPVRVDRDAHDGAFERDAERVDAVDADELGRLGATTLDDAMDAIAGASSIDVTASTTGIAVDGLPASWTRVLVDGAPVGAATNTRGGPVVDLSARPIDPSTIDRIEVHRGVGPAGSAGESGVIVHIVTRPPRDTAVTTRAGVGAGADTWTRRFASVSGEAPVGRTGGVRPMVFVEQREAVDVDGDADPDTTRSTLVGGSAEVAWSDAPGRLLRLRADVAGRDQLSLAGPGAPFDDRTTSMTWDATVDGTWRLAADTDVEHTTTVGAHTYDLAREMRSGATRTISDTSLLRLRNDVVLRLGPDDAERHVEVWADHTRVERSGDAGAVDPRSLHTVGVAAGQTWTAPSTLWDLSTRALVDLSDAFGVGGAGEVAVARHVGDAWTVRAAAARTRRLPSAEELFLFFDHADVGYAIEGNAALSPEHAWTGRAGIVARPVSRVQIELEGFAHRLDATIDTVATGDRVSGVPVFSYDNTGRARVVGANAGVRAGVVPSTLEASVSWAWLPIAESRAGDPLALRAQHRGRAEVRWFAWRDRLEVWTDVTGRTEQTVPAGADRAPGFATFDVGVAATPGGGVTVLAELINLTDQTDPTWGPAPGRMGLITLEWTTR